MRPVSRALLFCFVLAACSENRTVPATTPTLPRPAAVRSDISVPAEIEVGTIVPTDPTVRVTDDRGAPIAGLTVRFAPLTGAVRDSLVRTDGDGRAATQWTLGARSGAQQLSVSVSDLPPVLFNTIGRPGRVARLVIERGNEQTGVAGAALAVDPVVQLLDRLLNPVARARVRFTPDAGSGTVDPTDDVASDASGYARIRWTLGTTLGTQRMVVTSPGAERVGAIFTATATTGSPAQHIAFAGNNQSSAAYGALPVRPASRILDGNNNPIRGLPVTFAIVSGGGVITGATVTTVTTGSPPSAAGRSAGSSAARRSSPAAPVCPRPASPPPPRFRPAARS